MESLEWGADKFCVEQGVHYCNSFDSPHNNGGCREKHLASSRTQASPLVHPIQAPVLFPLVQLPCTADQIPCVRKQLHWARDALMKHTVSHNKPTGTSQVAAWSTARACHTSLPASAPSPSILSLKIPVEVVPSDRQFISWLSLDHPIDYLRITRRGRTRWRPGDVAWEVTVS